jgi:hypothetical protein
MSEMPEAQNRGSVSAPGMSLRNSPANSPKTVETWTPTFSNTRPCMLAITPPPPPGSALADPALKLPISGKPEIGRLPLSSARDQDVRTKRPAARSASGACAGKAASSASNAAQMSSRSVSNHVRARALRASDRLSLIEPPSFV